MNKAAQTLLILSLGVCSSLTCIAHPQENDNLIDSISKKMDSYPKYKSFKHHLISTVREMDRNWKPKKITVIEKNVLVTETEYIEEIHKAVETKDGRNKDVTEEYRKKAGKKKQDQTQKKQNEEIERRLSFRLDDLFPFEEGRREKFNFRFLDDSLIEDRAVCVLEVKPKVKEKSLLEGKYYIDRESLTVLKTELRPSKRQKYVKEFGMEISFEVLPEGYYVAKKTKMRVSGGIFIKHIRMEVEDEYSDYEILK